MKYVLPLSKGMKKRGKVRDIDGVVLKSRREAVLEQTEEILGTSGEITEYSWQEDGCVVYTYSVVDTPQEGYSVHSTLTLSEHTIDRWVDGHSLRVELILELPTACKEAVDILADCAGAVMHGGTLTAPGAIMRGFAEEYLTGSPLKHVMLIEPYLWDFDALEFPDRIVVWLQAILITDGERAYAIAHGHKALLDLLKKVDLADLDRPSVI